MDLVWLAVVVGFFVGSHLLVRLLTALHGEA